jgi:hypothetical protein
VSTWSKTIRANFAGVVLVAAGFVGPLTGNVTGNLTGNVTGNVSGSSGSTTGNAATATALANPRNINGVAFDGTANITVTAAAGTLSGTTLAATVTASSLTSVGTLASLAVTGNYTSAAGKIGLGTTPGTASAINVDAGSYSSSAFAITNGATAIGQLTISGTTQMRVLAASSVGLYLGANGSTKWAVEPDSAGTSTFSSQSAIARIVSGATSWAVRDSTNASNNLIITDAGAATFRSTVSATGNIYTDAIYLGPTGDTLRLRSASGRAIELQTNGGTTALTLSTAQSATFAGNVAVAADLTASGTTLSLYPTGATTGSVILSANGSGSPSQVKAYGATHATKADIVELIVAGVVKGQLDKTAVAGNTALMIYDVDNATLERVTVGAADSGGAGFKLLRIPN